MIFYNYSLEKSVKLGFQKKYLIYVWRVWIVIRYFLFEKQAFHGLLKVGGMQIIKLLCIKRVTKKYWKIYIIFQVKNVVLGITIRNSLV